MVNRSATGRTLNSGVAGSIGQSAIGVALLSAVSSTALDPVERLRLIGAIDPAQRREHIKSPFAQSLLPCLLPWAGLKDEFPRMVTCDASHLRRQSLVSYRPLALSMSAVGGDLEC